jgi:quercetin dioxygenase-like cupin family protein
MKQMNRRDLGIAISAFAALSAIPGDSQTPTQAQAGAASVGGPVLAHSEIFAFDKLPVRSSPNGMETRAVLRGTLTTGEYIEVHETVLPPGEMPHPPHRHTHSEVLLIREGRLEVTSDGQHGFVEPGGVIFTASGVLHGLKNVGATPANYFVVAVGLQKAIG